MEAITIRLEAITTSHTKVKEFGLSSEAVAGVALGLHGSSDVRNQLKSCVKLPCLSSVCFCRVSHDPTQNGGLQWRSDPYKVMCCLVWFCFFSRYSVGVSKGVCCWCCLSFISNTLTEVVLDSKTRHLPCQQQSCHKVVEPRVQQ